MTKRHYGLKRAKGGRVKNVAARIPQRRGDLLAENLNINRGRGSLCKGAYARLFQSAH